MQKRSRLQQNGIYYHDGDVPGRSFAVMLLDLNLEGDITLSNIRSQLSSLFRIYQNINKGRIKDLPGIEFGSEGSLTYLIGYGKRLFQNLSRTECMPELLKIVSSFNDPKVSRFIWNDSGLEYSSNVIKRGKNNGDADVIIQFISDSESETKQAVFETWKYLYDKKEKSSLNIVGYYTGYRRNDYRNVLDFLDGISNLKSADRKYAIFTDKGNNSNSFEKKVKWISNSTFMCFMRFLIDISRWRGTKIALQQEIIGRHKYTGCPLDYENTISKLNGCPTKGSESIFDRRNAKYREYVSKDDRFKLSHIGRVRQAGNDQIRIFRQGYNFFDTSPVFPYFVSGLNFVSFQRNPCHIFTILNSPVWMGGVNLGGSVKDNPLEGAIKVESAGIYFIPPVNNKKKLPGIEIFLKNN